MLTLEEVAALATALPEVTVGERRGDRTWSVGGKAFAWERPFTKADLRRFGDEPVPAGPVVAIRLADLAEKAALLAADLPGLFTTPHFDGYAAVLVDLATAEALSFREVLLDGWLAQAPAALAAAHRPDLG